jgi:hypothetical protein
MKPDFSFTGVRQYLTTDAGKSDGGHKLAPSIVDTFRFERYEYGMDCHLDAPHDMPSTWRQNVVATRRVFRGIVRAALCDLFGHHYEDSGSYATPDSGAEHFECSRCHHSFHHIYY